MKDCDKCIGSPNGGFEYCEACKRADYAYFIPESEQPASAPVESPSAGSLEFRDLSQEAQKLIVDAVLGVYVNGAPEIPESVRDEIRRWASESPENDKVSGGALND